MLTQTSYYSELKSQQDHQLAPDNLKQRPGNSRHLCLTLVTMKFCSPSVTQKTGFPTGPNDNYGLRKSNLCMIAVSLESANRTPSSE